jgi:hypothetical protein
MKNLFATAGVALVLGVALMGGCNPGSLGSDLTLSAANYATLQAGQSIAQVVPIAIGSVGGQKINAAIVVGVNVNSTTIAAALAAINGTGAPLAPGSVLLEKSVTIPTITIHTPPPK